MSSMGRNDIYERDRRYQLQNHAARFLALCDVIYGDRRHLCEQCHLCGKKPTRRHCISSEDLQLCCGVGVASLPLPPCPPAPAVSARLWAMTLAMARPSWPI